MSDERSIKVRVKLITETPLIHQIYIKGLTNKDLSLVDGMYVFEVNRKNKQQMLRVKLKINPRIIDKKIDVKRDIAHIHFIGETFNILIERNYSFQNIINNGSEYLIKYNSNQFQFKVEVINQLHLPYYEKIHSQMKEKTLRTKKNKSKWQDQILSRDFIDSDSYRSTYSPNSDAGRSWRVSFGGNVANLSRRR